MLEILVGGFVALVCMLTWAGKNEDSDSVAVVAASKVGVRHEDVTTVDDTDNSEPTFKFLDVKDVGSGKRVLPNARSIQTFESAYGTGKVIIALKAKGNEDPHFAHVFKGKNRIMEMKFQLTLKEDPRGIMYLGGSVPDKMKLGFVTRGLCKAILAVLNRLSSFVHAGFGKKMDSAEECELPHIVFPLYAAANKLVVTKAGEAIPELDNEIAESDVDMKKRLKCGLNRPGELKRGDTITFSVHSAYVDVIRWKVTGLGALGDMDLGMFWGKMPLNLLLYDMSNFDLKKNKLHSESLKRSYINFRIENTCYKQSKGEPVVVYPSASKQLSTTVVETPSTIIKLPVSPLPQSMPEEKEVSTLAVKRTKSASKRLSSLKKGLLRRLGKRRPDTVVYP